MSKCTNPTQRQTSFFFNTRLYLIRQAFTTLFIHTQTYSGRMTGYRAVVFSESTQSNIILLLEKEKEKGNHGNDIFQAGESLDRHAFKAPFVCSRKMDAVFHCVQLHSGVCRQRRLEQASLSEHRGKSNCFCVIWNAAYYTLCTSSKHDSMVCS